MSKNDKKLKEDEMDDDDDPMDVSTPVKHFGQPKQPVLHRYDVAGNIFEVPDKFELKYAIGLYVNDIIYKCRTRCIWNRMVILLYV
jgi:hypothetical protein